MTGAPQTLAEELAELAEWDWVNTGGDVLHHLAEWDDIERAGDDWGGPGRTSCNRRVKWACIPGFFTRMSAKRCERCCKALGYPQGAGSPKNSKAIRPLVEARLETRA